MKLGIVTYTSLHCNFTNYGTVLQAWAMQQTLNKFKWIEPVLVDYCPKAMKGKDPLDPMKNMWDTNHEARSLCEQSLPAIRENYRKICDFYHQKMEISQKEYDVTNFDDIKKEGIDRFLIGSDSIFDIDEFGLDDVFFANTPLMTGHSIAYAPSFQDSIDNYTNEDFLALGKYLHSFIAFSLRENQQIQYVRENVREDVEQVLDPTLLLKPEEYETIMAEKQLKDGYILYYSRRYNYQMESLVYDLSGQSGLPVVEISLRANNAGRGIMRYDAGVEEFLSLIKHSSVVITNSYHCLIFAVLFSKPFFVFSREHCDRKIIELLQMLGLEERFCETADIPQVQGIDYAGVHKVIEHHKEASLDYLRNALESLRFE